MTYKDRFARGEKAKRVQHVSPKFFEFNNVGDRIYGRLIGTVDVRSTLSEGTYKQYIVETDEGLVKFALGGATDKELAPVLKIDGIYRFVFDGQVKIKGGQRVNKFTVDQLMEEEEEEKESEDASAA